LIKSIINLIQKLEKLVSAVISHNVVKIVDVDEDNGNFTLFIGEVLLA
jgi:hypothetical protein